MTQKGDGNVVQVRVLEGATMAYLKREEISGLPVIRPRNELGTFRCIAVQICSAVKKHSAICYHKGRPFDKTP
jgi:hypothetical protein